MVDWAAFLNPDNQEVADEQHIFYLVITRLKSIKVCWKRGIGDKNMFCFSEDEAEGVTLELRLDRAPNFPQPAIEVDQLGLAT